MRWPKRGGPLSFETMETFRSMPPEEPLEPLCLECMHAAHFRACRDCGKSCTLRRVGRITMWISALASFCGLLGLFMWMRSSKHGDGPPTELRLVVGGVLATITLVAIIYELRRRALGRQRAR